MEELKSCPFCGKPLYIKIKRYTKPLLAPLTPAAALRDELIDITGEDYVPIKAEYCPVCGKPLNRRAVPENPRRKSGTESAENGSASAPDGGGNRPLTLNQLRQMDGEPVWIEYQDSDGIKHGTWAINWDAMKCVSSGYLNFKHKTYGKTWLAYARKPEGSGA